VYLSSVTLNSDLKTKMNGQFGFSERYRRVHHQINRELQREPESRSPKRNAQFDSSERYRRVHHQINRELILHKRKREYYSAAGSKLFALHQNGLDEIVQYLDHAAIGRLRRTCGFAHQQLTEWSGIRVYGENFVHPHEVTLSFTDGSSSTISFDRLLTSQCPTHIDVICSTEEGVRHALENWEETSRKIISSVDQCNLCILMRRDREKPDRCFVLYIWNTVRAKCSPDKCWDEAKSRFVHKSDVPLRWVHEVGKKSFSESCLRLLAFYSKHSIFSECARHVYSRLQRVTRERIWISPDVPFKHRIHFPPESLWNSGKRAMIAYYCFFECIKTDKDLYDKKNLCAINGMPMAVLQLLCLDQDLMSLDTMHEFDIHDQRFR